MRWERMSITPVDLIELVYYVSNSFRKHDGLAAVDA